MDRTRWEILVLAAAILVGALAIASSMRANRYYFANGTTAVMLDSHTGGVYYRTGNEDSWQTRVKPVK